MSPVRLLCPPRVTTVTGSPNKSHLRRGTPGHWVLLCVDTSVHVDAVTTRRTEGPGNGNGRWLGKGLWVSPGSGDTKTPGGEEVVGRKGGRTEQKEASPVLRSGTTIVRTHDSLLSVRDVHGGDFSTRREDTSRLCDVDSPLLR